MVIGEEDTMGKDLQVTFAAYEQDFPYLTTLNKILLDESDKTEFELMIALVICSSSNSTTKTTITKTR